MIGNVETLEPSQSATVSTNIDEEQNIVYFNFGIPQGVKGDTGDINLVNFEVENGVLKAYDEEGHIYYLGTVAMEPKGEYSATTSYEKLNTVLYNDSTYMALKSTLGNLPTDTEYWQLIGGGVTKEYLDEEVDEKLEDFTMAFDTVALMKASTYLKAGMVVKTLGYYSANDGGGSTYKIRLKINDDVTDEATIISLNDNTLVAEFISDEVINIRQMGGKSDGTSIITVLTNANKTSASTIYFPSGSYLLDGTITISKNLKGQNATINMNRTNDSEFGIEFTGNNLKIENLKFHSISSNKLLEIRDSNNVILSNCKFTTETTGRTGGGVLDIYRNNRNILVENCYFETHSNGPGGIWVREGSTNGYTSNVVFNNCEFIGDTSDETIAIWGWKGTIENVNVINSKITRPLNTNITNAFPITIGQSGITKNSGFENCIIDIYQANSCIFHVGYTDDKNLYLRNCVVNTYMQSLSSGITNLLGSTDGFIVENCKFNLLNETTNPTIANNTNIKYKNCEFNSQTQIELSIANIENCIINNNPLTSRSGTIARTLYAKNCVFNHINNTSTHLIRCLNTNDSIKIENCTFNYESTSTNTNFVQASGTNYSETLPLIIKDNIFKGRLYVDSTNISSGYVIGNYIGYASKGYLSSNLMDLNNEVNFTY